MLQAAMYVINVSGAKYVPNTLEVFMRVCPRVKPADLIFRRNIE